MGYPDKVRDIFAKLTFNEEDSLFDIVRSLGKIRMLDALSQDYIRTAKAKIATTEHQNPPLFEKAAELNQGAKADLYPLPPHHQANAVIPQNL